MPHSLTESADILWVHISFSLTISCQVQWNPCDTNQGGSVNSYSVAVGGYVEVEEHRQALRENSCVKVKV
jgi:hypothetical protein